MSMKNSNDTTGNQTRDLPNCSAVPQQTTPPRVPTCGANTFELLSILQVDSIRPNIKPVFYTAIENKIIYLEPNP
jgi:hypothetical protein